MDLLKKKLSIIEKILKMTDDLSTAVSEDDYDEMNRILDERQFLMKSADEIDLQIKSTKIDEEEKIYFEQKIKSDLEKIININDEIKLCMLKNEQKLQKKISEIDLKIKTGNYDISDNEKKPKGYYLNKKS